MVGAKPDEISGIGITNQRETTIVWDKKTGQPVYPAIVWQCRRTAPMIDALVEEGFDKVIRERTGLIPDAYFSASKIAWILQNVEGAGERAAKGELLFGTVDTWLIYNLTKGRVHVTDYTNASRTMLFDIHRLAWDKEILSYFGIPASMLPEVKPSSCIYGYTDLTVLGGEIPIAGAAGRDENVDYALEGSVFVAGAAIQWLRDGLKMIESAPQSESLAREVGDTGGVYLVPAFAGMGAPYWNPYARGMMVGLTRGCAKEHFVRATLESIAYQAHDVLKAMEQDAGFERRSLLVDGGASANDFLMQFQADILHTRVCRGGCIETTALGAAYLAGLATGFYRDLEEIRKNRKPGKNFMPVMEEEKRNELLAGWKKAVKCALLWAEE